MMTDQEYGSASAARNSPLPIQTGALPWRLSRQDGIEVLLVTGRRSGQWSIPKGWPMPGKSLAEAAMQEAYEEAGVLGTIAREPIGSFRHIKQHGPGENVEVDILVHPMWVDRELEDYPEAGERKRRWFSTKEAMKRVASPQLAELIDRSAAKPPQN